MLKVFVKNNYFLVQNESNSFFMCYKENAVIYINQLNTNAFDIHVDGVRIFENVLFSNIKNENDIAYTSESDFINWYTTNTGS
jgi:hypothetical protein